MTEFIVNIPAFGYGSKENSENSLLELFAELYEVDHFPTYGQCTPDTDGVTEVSIADKQYFNQDVYYKRIKIAAETFLLEANARGREFDKDVHAFIVGLGLGVWKFSGQLQVNQRADMIQD